MILVLVVLSVHSYNLCFKIDAVIICHSGIGNMIRNTGSMVSVKKWDFTPIHNSLLWIGVCIYIKEIEYKISINHSQKSVGLAGQMN